MNSPVFVRKYKEETKMKKMSIAAAVLALACVLFSCASTPVAPAVKGPEAGQYVAVCNGYDWGTGIDKIVINAGKKVSDVTAEDFTVLVEAEAFDWVGMFTTGAMQTAVGTAPRAISSAYTCDAAGNPVIGESEYVALELPVDPNTGAYLYFDLRDMMNHVPSVFNMTVSSEKLGLAITEGSMTYGLSDRFVRDQKSTTGDITLTYAYYRPETAKAGKTPLIIWLHGMGEGGTSSLIPLQGNKVANLASDEIQAHFGKTGAYVLVPQADGFWMQNSADPDFQSSGIYTPGQSARSYYTDALFNCIDEFVKAHSEIDANRIYIGGCSNGGYMTMNMIIEYPEYFAAAYPICEAYPDAKITDEKLAKLAPQHIWFTQAQNDGTVNPAECDVATVARLREAGAVDVKFNFPADVHDETGLYKNEAGEPYQYDGHWSWIYVLNNTIVDENGLSIMGWLAAQSK